VSSVKHQTFIEILREMEARGSRPCFSYIPDGSLDTVTELSYADVVDRARRFGSALKAQGVGVGDRVAMFAQPTPDYLTLLYGAILIGAVPTPFNHIFKLAEASAYLSYIDPKILIYDDTTEGVVEEVKAEGPFAWKGLQIDSTGTGNPANPAANLLRWSDHDRAEMHEAGADDVALILHTSGTTALPKGVMRKHKAICAFLDRWAGEDGYAWLERDTMLSWHPFYHQSGTLTSAMAMMRAGGYTIQLQRFSATRFWDLVQRHKPTVAQFVPPAATYLLLQPERPNEKDHTLEYAVIGGRTDHWADFVERFDFNCHSPYGSTETSYVTTTGGRNDPLVNTQELRDTVPHFYAGPVIPDFMELRIMTENGEAAPGQQGEIQIRGPALFEEYFRLPEATAEAIRDGWFCTGDIGYKREDGYIFMVDRARQVIRRSSENISPLEIEIILGQHPTVAECATLGVPDPIRGQEILSCVIPKEGQTVDPAELIAFAEQKLSAFKVPRYIEIWDSFPRTGTEKVRKEALQHGGPGIIRYDRTAATEKA